MVGSPSDQLSFNGTGHRARDRSTRACLPPQYLRSELSEGGLWMLPEKCRSSCHERHRRRFERPQVLVQVVQNAFVDVAERTPRNKLPSYASCQSQDVEPPSDLTGA